MTYNKPEKKKLKGKIGPIDSNPDRKDSDITLNVEENKNDSELRNYIPSSSGKVTPGEDNRKISELDAEVKGLNTKILQLNETIKKLIEENNELK